MNLSEYQRLAWRHDQHHDQPEKGLTIALLGLGGEVGTLQTTQKKVIRDDNAHLDSAAAAIEDLGDILWYVADAATWLGTDLDAVARANLRKIGDRWPAHDEPLPEATRPLPGPRAALTSGARDLPPPHLFDGGRPEQERLPRQLEVHLAEIPGSAGRVLPVAKGRPYGNDVGDNSYDPDGYRWHDAFHLAHLAVLGWSPVVRGLLRRKRRSAPRIDEVEDGGRAIAIEEGITAMVFEAAVRAGHYEQARVVDSDVLRVCHRMVAGLEASACTAMEWEQVVLRGQDAWRTIRDAGHGAVLCDMDARTVEARPLSAEELESHGEVSLRSLADAAAKKSARRDRQS